MASQLAGAIGLSVDTQGSQKGDVYSFAIILHEILYRCGLFHCVQRDVPILAKGKFTDRTQHLPVLFIRNLTTANRLLK